MKKKITLVATSVLLVAAMVIGGTLAYFTDTHSQTNTFTAGKVGIVLDEAKADGTDGRTTAPQQYTLNPGISVKKDPTITVDSDSQNAYVAAKIIIKGNAQAAKSIGDDDVLGVPKYETIAIDRIASGGLIVDNTGSYVTENELFGYKTDKCFVHQVADPANETWTLYVFMNEAQVKNAKIVLFETITPPASWDNAEMEAVNNMSVEVQAFAAQTEGFTSCYDAMTKAFPEAFVF